MESKKESPATEQERGNRRKMVGIVTSDKMDKTVVVMVTRRVRDAKFGKFVTKRAKYKAHSADNGAHIGDKVVIIESRPLSKEKRWRVIELVEKARRV